MRKQSHFRFNKQERSGIFFLLLIVIVLQCGYYYVKANPSQSETVFALNTKEQTKIDSLKNHQPEASVKIYPFNPNYLTDYKGYTLGLSTSQLDRLFAFRKKGKFVNSANEFQAVTKVSDSLLNEISPYFKFPEWVTQPKTKNIFAKTYSNTPKTNAQKTDLNTATSVQLQKVNGVGKTLSDRIIKYRKTFKGGFAADIELQEVYGLTPEVILKIKEQFTVKTPREISKLNINTASVDALVTIKYIDYEIAHNILEYRKLHEGFSSLNELSKVKDFPISKIEIIKLSLHIQ